MPRYTVEEVKEKNKRAIESIAQSGEKWSEFLKITANHLKQSFAEKALLSIDRSNSTALADYDFWTKEQHLAVKNGSKGFPYIAVENGKERVKYLFDITDTTADTKTIDSLKWSADNSEEFVSLVAEKLGTENKMLLTAVIDETVDLRISEEISKFSAFDDMENLSKFLRDSIRLAVYERCGLDTSLIYNDFSLIKSFNPKLITDVGNTVTAHTNDILGTFAIQSRLFKKEQNKKENSNVEKAADERTTAFSNAQNNIIGNTPYRYISKKTYRKFDRETAMQIVNEIEKVEFKYSGKINNDNTVTLTVSGDNINEIDKIILDVQAKIKEEKENANSFSEEEINLARKTNLIDFLQYKGVQLKRVGTNEYTMQEHDSMRISPDKGFYWNSRSIGGNALDFCMKVYNMNFQDAVSELLRYNGYNKQIGNNTNISLPKQKQEPKTVEEEHKPFPNDLDVNTNRVFAYLNQTRRISKETIKTFIDSGKVAQDIKGNAVFKIFDKDGILSGAEITTTLTDKRFKQTTERNGNGFSIQVNPDEPPNSLIFFESAVDLMSFYDIMKMQNEKLKGCILVSMGGLKDKVIDTSIEKYKSVYGNEPEVVFLAVDNDEAGKNFAKKIVENSKKYENIYFNSEYFNIEKYTEKNIKDWNDLLKITVEEKENTINEAVKNDTSKEAIGIKQQTTDNSEYKNIIKKFNEYSKEVLKFYDNRLVSNLLWNAIVNTVTEADNTIERQIKNGIITKEQGQANYAVIKDFINILEKNVKEKTVNSEISIVADGNILKIEENLSAKQIFTLREENLEEIVKKIKSSQSEFTAAVNNEDYFKANEISRELAELSKKADIVKKSIQAEAINDKDVADLRDIKPKRKSVQNMLDNEIAQTPKFEKLLNDEMGEKSPYEMRNGNNDWLKDESRTVSVIKIESRDLPDNITEVRKDKSIKKGTFVNKDTGMDVIFGGKSIDEIIAKAIPDNKRDIPIEARISAIYQMQELIENAVCFDSEISEHNSMTSKNKSPNTLFLHRFHSILNYNNKLYLANLSVEESYITNKENEFNGTLNRLYAFRDIEISPVKLLGFQSHADLQNASRDTLSGDIISIPQLYALVKEYDQKFFENPKAIGRADRIEEIKKQEDFEKAKAVLDEHNNLQTTVGNDGDYTTENEITKDKYNLGSAKIEVGIAEIEVNSDELKKRIEKAGLKLTENSLDKILYSTNNKEWHKFVIPDKYGNLYNNIDISEVLTEKEVNTAKEISEEVFSAYLTSENEQQTEEINTEQKEESNNIPKDVITEQEISEKSDIVKALENGKIIYISDTPVPMVADANAHYFSNQKLFKDDDGIYKLSGNVVKGSGVPNDFEMPFDTAEKAEAYINSHDMKFYIEDNQKEVTFVKVSGFYEVYDTNALDIANMFGFEVSKKNGDYMIGIADFRFDEIKEKLAEQGYKVSVKENAEQDLAADTNKKENEVDKVTVHFGFSESKFINEFAAENSNISFALGNAVIEYLDEKQHSEREIEELKVGWYDKTDFSIEFAEDGEEKKYSGRFDIGDGKGTGGGSLINHISDYYNGIINRAERNEYIPNKEETLKAAHNILDEFITFLEKNSTMTAEEEKIFNDFTAKYPIRTNIEIEENKQNTDNDISADSINNAVAKLLENHNFTVEEEKLIKRIGQNLIANKTNAAEISIFEKTPFKEDYGGTDRINNKFFNGNIEDIITELNDYINNIPENSQNTLKNKAMIEKYGLNIDFSEIAAVSVRIEDTKYIGGTDYDGHERKDNYADDTKEVSYYIFQDELIKYDESNDMGMMPIDLDYAVKEISEYLDKSITDNELSVFIETKDGKKEFLNAEKLLNESSRNNKTDKFENFRITNSTIDRTAREKFRDNIEAIKTLIAVESESRQATPEEQEKLSKYIGWGGLADAFDENKANWESEYSELKAILTPDEYNAARSSTLNAHYTSPEIIKAMYRVLENLGFEGGKILEPAIGNGRFFGCLPDSLSDKTKLYGVEIDSLTGRIAKQLYPNANIQIKGFEKTSFKSNSFDVTIGNVPFGNYRINDNELKSNDLIHDYFFKKALDKVKIGGVVAFITSKGTLDKKDNSVRKYLAERADLLGAVRLPNNAFSEAATEVTTDIIFLQKRENLRDLESDMPDWVNTSINDNNLEINNYFINNPEMVCGTLAEVSGRYGTEITCMPKGESLSELLGNAIKNIKGKISEQLTVSDEDNKKTETLNPYEYKNFCYAVINDEIYFRENSELTKQTFDKKKTARIKGMVEISETLRDLIRFQKDNYSDEIIKQQQEKLNSVYDAFTQKYGLLSDTKNRTAFKEDDTSALISTLENINEKGELESKADIFYRRTIVPYIPITHTDTSIEALAVSISEKAKVDLDFMSELCGKKNEEIISDLKGVIYENPSTNKYETADEYLSGNIREKLRLAEFWNNSEGIYNGRFEENIKALKEVMPIDLKPEEISVQLGSTWVPEKYYEQFMYELLDTPDRCRTQNMSIYGDDKNPFSNGTSANNSTIMVCYDEKTSVYGISNKSNYYADKDNVKANKTYGTDRINAYKIIEESLNLKSVKIFDYIDDENGNPKPVLNQKETLLAQEKQNQIKSKFKEWIFDDYERTRDLCQIYNEKFNSVRLREYDGSHITFGGMNPEIKLRKHQVDAVAHTIYGGNTLLAHSVGAGKTYTICASAMESKRLGLCSKSLICVPKHIVNQFAKEFLQLYPTANILVPSEKDFSKENRKKFCSRIATGNYDAIIISHTQLEKIPLSAERQIDYIESEIKEITKDLELLNREKNKGFSVKQLETTKKQLESKLEKLNNNSKRDDLVNFEDLGVDRLYVDEAHIFKNKYFNTKMGRNVSGINASSASQRATDLDMKCRYIDEKTGGKGLTFATGTPLSNSMSELYIMQSYLQRDELRKRGLGHFDAWASTFGETQISLELAPEGKGYQLKNRFSKFFNIPELMSMFKEIADIKTPDVLNLPVPKANYHTISTEASEYQKEIVDGFSERAENIRTKKVDSKIDNMLKITNEGRKLALDQRLINELLPDDENGKVNECIKNVYEIYKKTENERSTQMIFCDLSTPHYDGTFNVYDDIKEKLIKKGIPAEEVAFIHDCKTDEQKQALFTKVKNGEVRVLLGSTSKMGTGTNCQKKLKALHHIDCPYRPSDLEQRNGRIIRQGNENAEVDIYNYVTKGTFDAYLYQLVENKQRFVSQIMTSKSPARSAEDIDESVLNYAQIKAIASGNPKIKQKMDLDIEVSRLRTVFAGYQEEKRTLQENIAVTFPREIASLTDRIDGLKKDIAIAENNKSADFKKMTIDGVVYTDKKEAGTKLLESCRRLRPDERNRKIGNYKGFEMSVFYDTYKNSYCINLTNSLSHSVEIGKDIYGNLTRLDNCINSLSQKLAVAEDRLEKKQHQLDVAKIEVAKPFPQAEELREKEALLDKLNKELSEKPDKKDENKDNRNEEDISK